MAEECKHSDCRSSEDRDTGAHITVCMGCGLIRHVCFTPLDDEIEKGLEKAREWGVAFSKQARSPSMGAMVQKEMEKILSTFRTGLMQSRIDKKTVVETVAAFLDGQNQPEAAAMVRTLKLEPVVGATEKAPTTGVAL